MYHMVSTFPYLFVLYLSFLKKQSNQQVKMNTIDKTEIVNFCMENHFREHAEAGAEKIRRLHDIIKAFDKQIRVLQQRVDEREETIYELYQQLHEGQQAQRQLINENIALDNENDQLRELVQNITAICKCLGVEEVDV